MNPYVYVNDSPLRYVDPFGLQEEEDPAARDRFEEPVSEIAAQSRVEGLIREIRAYDPEFEYVTARPFDSSYSAQEVESLEQQLQRERESTSCRAAGGTSGALSEVRYTQAGEKFIRYESGHPGFSKLTPSGGVKPGTYAAPASEGVVPLAERAPRYNLPDPEISRPNVSFLEPPAGTPVIGPRPVSGGSGQEVVFPLGF